MKSRIVMQSCIFKTGAPKPGERCLSIADLVEGQLAGKPGADQGGGVSVGAFPPARLAGATVDRSRHQQRGALDYLDDPPICEVRMLGITQRWNPAM
jgi:hypothetical protein